MSKLISAMLATAFAATAFTAAAQAPAPAAAPKAKAPKAAARNKPEKRSKGAGQATSFLFNILLYIVFPDLPYCRAMRTGDVNRI